jgi:hypothetical protein
MMQANERVGSRASWGFVAFWAMLALGIGARPAQATISNVWPMTLPLARRRRSSRQNLEALRGSQAVLAMRPGSWACSAVYLRGQRNAARQGCQWTGSRMAAPNRCGLSIPAIWVRLAYSFDL